MMFRFMRLFRRPRNSDIYASAISTRQWHRCERNRVREGQRLAAEIEGCHDLR